MPAQGRVSVQYGVTHIFTLLGLVKRAWDFATGFLWARDRERRKAAEDALEAAERGRQGAAKARDELEGGKTPDEIVRNNDEAWK